MHSKTEHYLRKELVQLMQTDPKIFEFLEEGSLDGTWYWDLNDPDHEWMSDRMWEVLGYDPDEMPHLASAWQDMINPDDLKVAYANFQAHCADPNHPYDQVVRYTHMQGHTVWVRCRGMAIRDETGKPVRMLGAHQDITSLKLAEAKLRDNNAELAKANDELRRFAYAASHDLRSPVVTLNALVARLRQNHASSLNEQGQQLLELAYRCVQRISEMTDRVLDYSKVTRAALELSDVSVGELVAGVVESLGDAVQQTGATINVGAMPTVRGDRVMLRIAIQNLIENALKYTSSEPPNVAIAAQWTEERYTLTVADNGLGIDPEHRDRIFLGFERLHRRDEYAGVGLGLAMCAQVATMHDGTITVASNHPRGSVFTLELAVNPKGNA